MAKVILEVDGERTEYELGISQVIRLARIAAELTAEYQGHPQAKEEKREIVYVPYTVPWFYPPYPPYVYPCGSSSVIIGDTRTA